MRVAVGVLIAVAVGVGGYLLGHKRSDQSLVTSAGVALASQGGGTAWLGAGQPVDRATGFAYSLPQSVEWTDADGSVHEASHPTCLPYDHPVRVKNMKALEFSTPAGLTTGVVVWVQC
jgi:hypothetical protein